MILKNALTARGFREAYLTYAYFKIIKVEINREFLIAIYHNSLMYEINHN